MLLEDELIYQCINGNRIAQKELYEKYSPMFYAICRRYMPTKAEAEDVLIMSFTSIFEGLSTVKGNCSLENWMRKIIVNKSIEMLRRNQKHHELLERYDTWEEIRVCTSKNVIYSIMDMEYIMKKIQQLSDGYRMVFNLYVIDGYSYQDISDMLGINVGTVRSQLAKARKILQKELQDIR